jgi:hypothetical protein
MLDTSPAEGGKHSDFTDRPEYVLPAVEEIDALFKGTVGLWRQPA